MAKATVLGGIYFLRVKQFCTHVDQDLSMYYRYIPVAKKILTLSLTQVSVRTEPRTLHLPYPGMIIMTFINLGSR